MNIIKKIKKDFNLNQKEIAKILNTTQQQISKIENYKSNLTIKQILIINKKFKISIKKIIDHNKEQLFF